MNLGQFHEVVSDEVRRGTTVDTSVGGSSIVAARVRFAAVWLERNYNFGYMKRFQSFTLDSSAVEPRAIDIQEDIKRLHFLRIADEASDGTIEYRYLKRISPELVSNVGSGEPTHYWEDGRDYYWVNKIPDQDYSMEMYSTQYSTWPTDSDAEPWLVRRAEDVLFFKTMEMFGPRLRNVQMQETYAAEFRSALHTLMAAEQQYEFADDNPVMQYGKIYD